MAKGPLGVYGDAGILRSLVCLSGWRGSYGGPPFIFGMNIPPLLKASYAIIGLPQGMRFNGVSMKLPSVMSHDFGSVPGPQLNRSTFDRSFGYKTTFDPGWLIPFMVDEILPGDSMNLQARMLARLQGMIRPIMDNLFLDTFYFFVPSRILWTNWEKFNGAQDDPGDSTDFIVPSLDTSEPISFPGGSLYDYMGLPTVVTFAVDEPINALPFRAYNMIWNEWFRDQNMQDKVDVPLDDGPDNYGLYGTLVRGKRHDYFTSCLPFAQKGDAVTISLGTSAPVIGTNIAIGLRTAATNFGLTYDNSTGFDGVLRPRVGNFGDARGTAVDGAPPSDAGVAVGLSTDPAGSGMIADLSGASASTIDELREAVAFQHVLERDARGGTRYTEMLRAHWGVAPRDERLQRPEYLGGSSERINISAVASTTPTPAAGVTNRNTQASLAAYGTAAGRSGFNKSFSEYGYVIGLVNVRADLTYQQGLRRMWSRSTRFDFPLPDLMHLGEQPVYQKEIFYGEAGTTAETVFGYQERYAEMRYYPSMVTDSFRSNTGAGLDSWHLALNFSAAPALDNAFIMDSPPLDRALAVPAERNLLLDCYVSLKHARCMPVYAVPGLERL